MRLGSGSVRPSKLSWLLPHTPIQPSSRVICEPQLFKETWLWLLMATLPWCTVSLVPLIQAPASSLPVVGLRTMSTGGGSVAGGGASAAVVRPTSKASTSHAPYVRIIAAPTLGLTDRK